MMLRNHLGARSMMYGYGSMGNSFLPLAGILWLITWAVVILVLVALFRWLWKKGDKVK